MSEYRLLMCIVRREQSEDYIAFMRSRGVEAQLVSLCHGTASRRILDYLGIEKTEKVLLQAMTPAAEAGKLLRRLVDRMGIEVSGNGDVNGNTGFFAMVAKDFYFRGNGIFNLKRHTGATTVPDIMPMMPTETQRESYMTN